MKRKKFRVFISMLLFAVMLCTVSLPAFAEGEADKSSQVADAGEMASPKEVGSEDMTPVYGDMVTDGQYEIEVDSSSSMFRIVHAVLTVKDGRMSAVLTLSGKGYGKLFPGTGEEAVNAPEDQYIPYVENEEGAYTYEIPVEALDKKIPCAAWSIKKEKWYDRDLVFKAESLPEGTADKKAAAEADSQDQKNGAPNEAKTGKNNADAVKTDASDGTYRLEVVLSGGSGKASITSPAEVTVKDGAVWAKIEWSSPNYDYMLVGGERYEPVNAGGNSVFEIPVLRLDEEFDVIADTTAMSTPHEVEYTLCFDSSGLEQGEKQSSQIPAAAIILVAAIVLIAAAGGILAVKKNRAKKR